MFELHRKLKAVNSADYDMSRHAVHGIDFQFPHNTFLMRLLLNYISVLWCVNMFL